MPERPGTMRAARWTSVASEKRMMMNELDLRMSGAEVDRRGWRVNLKNVALFWQPLYTFSRAPAMIHRWKAKHSE